MGFANYVLSLIEPVVIGSDGHSAGHMLLPCLLAVMEEKR